MSSPADRLELPLAVPPQPESAAQVTPPAEAPEPLDIMDRPIGTTVRDAAARVAEPARATLAWGKELATRAWTAYGGMTPSKPVLMAVAVAALAAWFLARTFSTLIQLTAVVAAAYAAYSVLAR